MIPPAAGQGLADDLLRLPGGIHVGGVDEIDTRIESPMDDPHGIVVVGISERAEHHGAEAEGTDLDSGVTENAIAHVVETRRLGPTATPLAAVVGQPDDS